MAQTTTVSDTPVNQILDKPGASNGLKKESTKFFGVFSSTTVWTVLILISFDLFLCNVRPLRYVKIPGIILKDQDSLGEQIEFLKADAKKRNILMFGTSLIRNAAAYADGISEEREFTQYQWYRYYDAHSCDQLFKSKLGIDSITSTVMAEGGFFYDYWRLLQIGLESGAKPKLVVLAVAPKDFADSTRTLEDSHVNLFFKLRNAGPSEVVDLRSALDAVCRQFWQFYRVRADYHTVGEVFACSLFDRAPTLYAALHEKVVKRPEIIVSFEDEKIDLINSIQPELMDTHIKYYRSVYATAKASNRQQQYDFFVEALAYCNRKNIHCIVVNMPMSKRHNAMMSKDLKDSYLNHLSTICDSNSTKLVNLMEDSRFTSSDFVDVVHLNGTGALKFWEVLSDEIAKDDDYKANLVESFDQSI